MKLKIKYGGGEKIITEVRDHKVICDQSIDDGGENKAPNPFEYFFVSIGACTATYVYRFCKVRKIDRENITVDLSLGYDDTGKIGNKVNVKINVPDDFPNKYKKALIKAASQCSVKRFIQSEPDINITI